MVIEQMPQTRASRVRRPLNPWPFVAVLMAVIGAVGGTFLAQH